MELVLVGAGIMVVGVIIGAGAVIITVTRFIDEEKAAKVLEKNDF